MPAGLSLNGWPSGAPGAWFILAPMSPAPLADEILRESIRSRAQQALPGLLALYAVLGVLALLLVDEVAPWKLAAWFVPLAAMMGARLAYSRRVLRRLDAAGPAELARADAWLRASSMANQALCGAGIWLAPGGSELLAFFVTLIIALFGVGAMINLVSDYRSFRLSLPLLIGQPIAFWLAHGVEGLRIAFPLLLLTLLMLSLVRGSSRTMAESVRMRFEKTALLERVEREREAASAALDMARNAMRARAIFLASASHDLRQPLYAIALLADALQLEPLGHHAAEILTRQRQAIGVLRTLFDNLLDLSRFEAGEIRPALRDTSLREALLPLCDEYDLLCRSKHLAWRATIDDVWVHTDPELVRRLAGNLLSNAVRYTDAGEVSLATRVEGERVVLTVADTGPGIAEADRERVFDEFVQLANPARDRDRGVGLGLSIVKLISELLQARVRLDSAAGRGTRVTFELPLAATGQVAEPVAVRGTRPGEFLGLRLWVVEDDPLVREGLASHFRNWGLEHAFVVSREELLRLREAQGAWPDAVMLDDMLGPGERGLEIAHWLRESIPAERIVLVTGNVDPERTRELERSGFVVLLKPLAAQDIAQWIADATLGVAE